MLRRFFGTGKRPASGTAASADTSYAPEGEGASKGVAAPAPSSPASTASAGSSTAASAPSADEGSVSPASVTTVATADAGDYESGSDYEYDSADEEECKREVVEIYQSACSKAVEIMSEGGNLKPKEWDTLLNMYDSPSRFIEEYPVAVQSHNLMYLMKFSLELYNLLINDSLQEDIVAKYEEWKSLALTERSLILENDILSTLYKKIFILLDKMEYKFHSDFSADLLLEDVSLEDVCIEINDKLSELIERSVGEDVDLSLQMARLQALGDYIGCEEYDFWSNDSDVESEEADDVRSPSALHVSADSYGLAVSVGCGINAVSFGPAKVDIFESAVLGHVQSFVF